MDEEKKKKKIEPIYHAVNVHVPHRTHEKLMKAVTKSGPVSVRLDLTEEPRDKVYVTWGNERRSKKRWRRGERS